MVLITQGIQRSCVKDGDGSVSYTHLDVYKRQNLDRILDQAGTVDMFIHLGDVEGGAGYLDAVVDCEKHMVKGNNDFFSDLPKEEELSLIHIFKD